MVIVGFIGVEVELVTNPSLDLFLSACEQGEPSRLIIRASGSVNPIVRRHRFPGPFAILGSHPDADITIHEPGLKQRHYYFQVVGFEGFLSESGG